MRLAAFIISIMLLAGWVDPTTGWLIALTVLTALAALRVSVFHPLMLRPALDFRLGAFVLSAMLLAGAVDANRDWLIVLTTITGIAWIWPRLISLERREPWWHHQAWWARDAWWSGRDVWWSWCWPDADWTESGTRWRKEGWR
jgi:hypothetical protein